MKTAFARELMVKQFVGDLHTPRGVFRVFETGDEKFYLFDPLDPFGCSGCIGFPVRKTDLKPAIRRLLQPRKIRRVKTIDPPHIRYKDGYHAG